MKLLLEKNLFIFEDDDEEYAKLKQYSFGDRSSDKKVMSYDGYSKCALDPVIQSKFNQNFLETDVEPLANSNASGCVNIIKSFLDNFESSAGGGGNGFKMSVKPLNDEVDNFSEIESDFYNREITNYEEKSDCDESQSPVFLEHLQKDSSGSNSEALKTEALHKEIVSEISESSHVTQANTSGYLNTKDDDAAPIISVEIKKIDKFSDQEIQGNAVKGSTNLLAENNHVTLNTETRNLNDIILWIVGIFLFCCVLSYFVYKSACKNSDTEKLPDED